MVIVFWVVILTALPTTECKRHSFIWLLKALQFILSKSGDESHMPNSPTLSGRFGGTRGAPGAARPRPRLAPQCLRRPRRRLWGQQAASPRVPHPPPLATAKLLCFCGFTCSIRFLQMELYSIELRCRANFTEHIVLEVHPHCITGPMGNLSEWQRRISPVPDSEKQQGANQHTGNESADQFSRGESGLPCT